VARRRVHAPGGGVDGGAEAAEDLPPGLPAAVPARARRGHPGRGPPLEPARARRGQRRGPVPGVAPGAHQPAALERQGQAVAPARRAPPVRHRLPLGALRPLPPLVQAGDRGLVVVVANNPRYGSCRGNETLSKRFVETEPRIKHHRDVFFLPLF
jgi:hypothetical protein